MGKIKLLSLFSGIGAFEKALDRIEAEYKLIGYSEIDKYASRSYAAIHNVAEPLNLGDIKKIDEKKLPKDIDLITYGFPCQDISTAGKQRGFLDANGNQTRSGLFFDALRIIKAGYGFGLYVGLYVYKERWFDFNAFAGTRLWIARYYRGYRTMRFDDEPDQKYKPDVDGDISGWQYTSCGEIPGIKGDVDLDIAYEDPMLWSQPAVEPGVIYTVSVADVWTREQAEVIRQQFAAMGINGIVHKVKILE